MMKTFGLIVMFIMALAALAACGDDSVAEEVAPTSTAIPVSVPAQDFVVPEKEVLEDPELGSVLNDLVSRVESGEVSDEDAAGEAPLSRDDAVGLTIRVQGNVDTVVERLAEYGVTPRHVGEDYIEAFVPIGSLREVSGLEGVSCMEAIVPPQSFQEPLDQNVLGNGPATHGSVVWNESGFTGEGIRLGIIDVGFDGASGLLGTELPRSVKARCYGVETDVPGDLESCGGGNHGTLVAEAVIDIAPEASLYLAAVQSKGDLADIIDWMAAEGVSVVNVSLGWTFDGPGDGTSPRSDSPLNTLEKAVDNGMVWVNAAGNGGASSWFGAPSDLDGDGVLEFGSSGQELNISAGGAYVVQLRWEGSWGGEALDVDLYGHDGDGNIVMRSENVQDGSAGDPFEIVHSSSEEGVVLRVVNRGDSLPEWVQVVVWQGAIAESNESGGITNPGESAAPGMLSVGAAHWDRLDAIEGYSSRGPAPDGRLKPDLVGAACGDTALEGDGAPFCGTSQAAPHIAGMAALVLQRFPGFSAEEVVEFLLDSAEDRGIRGPDNDWGAGLAVLPKVVMPTPTVVVVATPTVTPTVLPTVVPTAVATVTAPVVPLGPNRDREALEALYRATNGDDWDKNTNWLSDKTLDEWHGIDVGENGYVWSVGLQNNGLSGVIPGELGLLSGLGYLNLVQNDLSGEIPPELGNLSSLIGLALDVNGLSGEVPWELGRLSRLHSLSLGSNNLSGSIPVELSELSELSTLALAENELSGSIPKELGRFERLQILRLDGNRLEGSIPVEVFGLSRLTFVMLNDNHLSGPIPAEVGALERLHTLNLSNNRLSDQIPPEIGDALELDYLDLGGNELSGSIPPEIGNLVHLTYLRLSDNQLGDSIPLEIVNLVNLYELGLEGNQLSGTIPERLVDLKDLRRLLLVQDGLGMSGCIPIGIAVIEEHDLYSTGLPFCEYVATPGEAVDRKVLVAVYLSGQGHLWGRDTNWMTDAPISEWDGVEVDGDGRIVSLHVGGLVGPIVPEIGDLSMLRDLRLGGDLSGSIPPELGRLTRLEYLDLSRNELSGALPPELGDLSALVHLYLFRNQLSGSLPNEMLGMSELGRFFFEDNDGLCMPTGAAFRDWRENVDEVLGPDC